MFMQVASHEGGTGGNNASFVAAATGDNIKGHGGAEVDDDGGGRTQGDRTGGVGQSILADFVGLRVVQRNAEIGLMVDLPNG